jgi:hypothetical protein
MYDLFGFPRTCGELLDYARKKNLDRVYVVVEDKHKSLGNLAMRFRFDTYVKAGTKKVRLKREYLDTSGSMLADSQIYGNMVREVLDSAEKISEKIKSKGFDSDVKRNVLWNRTEIKQMKKIKAWADEHRDEINSRLRKTEEERKKFLKNHTEEEWHMHLIDKYLDAPRPYFPDLSTKNRRLHKGGFGIDY